MMDPTSPPPSQGITVDQLLRHITPVAWVTPALTALILVGFGVEVALGVSVSEPTAAELLAAGGQFGPYFAEGGWWRVFSQMFLHSGPLHLAFNVWAFWGIGRLTERLFGNRSFLGIYILSGVAGSLSSVAQKPFVVGVGASGAIFGVYGALLAFVLLHRGVFPVAYLARQRNSIIGFIGYNVLFGLAVKNTDMAAHAGGFVAGALMGSVLSRDLLDPGKRAGLRLLIVVGFALALFGLALAVRARIRALPEMRVQHEAELGREALRAKHYSEAIAHFTAALSVKRDFDVVFARGVAYAQTNDLKAAETDILEAHRMNPAVNTEAMLCEIGVREQALPQADRAALDGIAAHCSAAIAGTAAPEKARLLVLRSFVHELAQRTGEAQADIDAALESDEHLALARSRRVLLRLAAKALPEAEQDCEKLLGEAAQSEPEHRATDLEACARVAHARRDLVVERARLGEALAIAPNHLPSLFARAQLNAVEGRLPESLADYTTLVSLAPEMAAAWNNRAWLEVELGDFATARADADRAVALDASPWSLGTRCFALVGLGELRAAREDCARSVEATVTLADRGMLAFIDKRYADARRDWQMASADPDLARSLKPWLARLPAH